MKAKLLLYCLILFCVFLPVWAQADTKKIEGTTNVEDAGIREAGADNNYGGYGYLEVTLSGGLYKKSLIRVQNVASELGAGATITACVCSVYNYWNYTDGNTSAYRVFKDWVEGDESGVDDDDGDVTWNDFQSDALEWGTEGCICANDDGVDNSSDDGACDVSTRRDRKATAEDVVNVTTSGTWYAWDISASLAQGWYDGTINEEGIILITEEGDNVFYSTEYGSLQPFWTFTYTTGEPPEAGQVIIIGAKDEENYHNPRFVCPDLGR